MRIVYFGNNWTGWQVLRWLKQQGEQIVGLVLHPDGRRKFGSEMLALVETDEVPVFDGSQLRRTEVQAAVRALKADIGLSVLFGYILKDDLLGSFPSGCINLHPALLPYNRGAYPNVWSIIEGTPSGATLHYVDESMDTGDIIAQEPVDVEPVDTGATLYRKLEAACVELFCETWPQIKAGTALRRPQGAGVGSEHRVADVRGIDEIDLERTYRARDLINLLRARTFSPHHGAYFVQDGRKVYINVELRYEAQP